MIQKVIKTFVIFSVSVLLVSCGGERRVDGELAFDSESLMNMANSFLTAGDYGNAMRLFQRAANENPNHIPSRLGMAKTYQSMGALDAALNFYGQVLRLDPDNIEAKVGTGQMLITRNRPADAIPYLVELSKQDPKNYKIYNMLGLAHDLLGEQEEAQMNYGRGLTLAVDNISLLNNLALSFAFEGQYAPAIKLLSKAIGLDYTVTKAQQNLVLAYVMSGEEAAGRKIGASIMTAEEMENNIRFYKWVKSLKPGQRAQAVFLGIKDFPEDKKKNPVAGVPDKAPQPMKRIPNDPKKRELKRILDQESKDRKRTSEPVVKTAPVVKQAPAKPVAEQDYVVPQKVYRVQLASYPNTALAAVGWKKIKRRSKGLLEPFNPLIKLVTLANGKNLFRLFVRDIEDRAAARSLCEGLRDVKIDCLVLKTLK